MSELSIYTALRTKGLSPAGACGVMGNMFAESGLRSNNVQDNCPMGDKDYTYNVDNGMMTRWQFMSDGYGYGLCQWTASDRKDKLYTMTRSLGVSISDEAAQCQFCIEELQSDYEDLYKYLCETDNLKEATERVCKEFERPAINNVRPRYEAAQRYLEAMTGDGCTDSCPITITPAPIPAGEKVQISVRVLRKGDKGRDVFLLQCALADIGIECGKPDGDFGPKTDAGVRELQRNCELGVTGVADQGTWQIVFQ